MEPKLNRPVLPAIIAGVAAILLVGVLVFAVILSLQARTALCTYKGNLEVAAQSSRDFLRMTPAERVHKYGALGQIPESTVKQSLAGQDRAVRSLSGLHC